MNGNNIFVIKNISKVFPGVLALNNISFEIKRGEFHSIVGENGAGKSTLMNILAGVFSSTSGSIIFDGQKIKLKSPRHAQHVGISMIHQELSLFSSLSIAENIFMSRLPKNNIGLINKTQLYNDTKNALKYVKLEYLDPNTLIGDISIAQQQLVEIAKSLAFNSKAIIMDEPTSSLTETEVKILFDIISDLKQRCITIIYISHKLHEIMELSNTITVMRDGQHIQTTNSKDMTLNKMISLMVGRQYNDVGIKQKFINDYDNCEKIMELKEIRVGKKVRNVSFDLYKGETLGITGLVGAGRSELVQAIFGADKMDSGTIIISGKQVIIKSTKDAIDCGLGLVPQGRKLQGIFNKLSVRDNISSVYLKNLRNKIGLLNLKSLDSLGHKFIDKLSIKTPSLDQCINNLSGGNQQKVVIGKWLMNNPKILILDEPTQGIDIVSKEEIYALISELNTNGISIILISSEMQETLTLCDRVIVMNEGKVTGEIKHQDISENKVMHLATAH